MSKNYTVEEVADALRVSKRTILREIGRGRLPAKKAGRRYIIDRSVLNAYTNVKGKGDQEYQIEQYIDNNKSEMVAMLQRLVSIPSESRKSELKNISQFLSNRLRKLGIRTITYGKGESITVRGTSGYAKKGILFDCPLDTAPVGNRDEWKYPAFDGVIKKGKMFGRGTADCKGGMVAMIYAVSALRKYLDEKSFRVELVFDGGEHSGAYDGMRETLKRGLDVEAGIVGYGGTGNKIALGCRGYHRYKVNSNGYSVHSGARFKAGVNAIENMAALITEMKQVKFPKPKDKYFSFGSKMYFTMIEGGKAINIVPDNCVSYLDVRTTPEFTRKKLEKVIKNLVDSATHRHKGFEIEIEYLVGQEGYRIDEKNRFVLALRDAAKAIRRKEPGFIVHGPAHIGTLLATKGVPVLVYGPDGGGLHSYNEYVELESVLRTAKIYARSIMNYFGVED